MLMTKDEEKEEGGREMEKTLWIFLHIDVTGLILVVVEDNCGVQNTYRLPPSFFHR